MDRRKLLPMLPIAAVPLLVWAAARLATPEPPHRDPLAPPPAAVPRRVASYPVPPDVAELLRQGRNWRAARLLRERVTPSSDPGLVLLAARAEAGWGGWSSVRSLLDGKPWLATTEQ